jgi:LuxR family transcriptional regulator, maltose regulon positive regulatory protein
MTVSRRRLTRPFFERLAMIGKILGQSRTKDFAFTQPDEMALLDDLREACRAARGEPPQLAGSLERETSTAEVSPLTPRELQLLELLDLGLDNQLIADRVGLTVPTVKWHLYNLYAKLQVKSRAAALAKARSLNLLQH